MFFIRFAQKINKNLDFRCFLYIFCMIFYDFAIFAMIFMIFIDFHIFRLISNIFHGNHRNLTDFVDLAISET